MKTTNLLLAAALAFFACTNDPDPQDDINNNVSSSPNETADISSQVYLLQKEQIEQAGQCMSNKDKTCFLNAVNIPYTGSGVIKIFDHEKATDTVEIGTISNGKIDLKFYTPKKENLNEDGYGGYLELELYDNANKPIGILALRNFEYLVDATKEPYAGFYQYFSNDYIYKYTRDIPKENVLPDPHDVKLVYDIDVKSGWNLIYETDKYDYDEDGKIILSTTTTSNNPDILNGNKLKWYLGRLSD